jgi:C-terminal processing protease CtpA/Prc
MWVDDLEVTINNKPLEKASLKKLSIADMDNEFTDGSNITIPKLNDKNLANLELLGRIWGFIKYYHPEIATGNINWDYELFRVLPNYLNVKNDTERDAVILRWIEELGDILPCKTCKILNKKAFITPDLAWLNQPSLSKDLSNKLNYIKNNRFQGNHYYVKPAPGVGNPIFKNEKPYANIPEADQGFKLLAVYRYWNMIQYFFPYKNETDQDWNTVLAEMITKIMKTDSDIDHHLALLEMAVKIDDSHGWFTTKKLRKYFGFNTLPFKFKIINDKVVVTEFTNKELAIADDIKIGDAIETINSTPVAKLLKDNSKYIYASNPSVKKRNAKKLIFKGEEDSVNITFERDGRVTSKTIKKYNYTTIKSNLQEKKTWDILDGNIGYVNMGILTVEEVKETMEALKNTKGIVFDIRNYPKGTMYEIAKYLHTEPVEFVKFTKQDFSYPGTFVWVDSYSCGGGKLKNQYKGKVVILVNETTQSHAEFTTMALQTAKGAVIIGSQTSGADGNVSKVPVVGGHSSSITGIGIYYPDGKETQRIGIVPDIKVLPTIKGIRAGIDEPLEKAIEVINLK